jgi:rRNA processing protein Gar1
LARFFNQKNFIHGIKESDFRNWLQMEVANKDHGVLSSLVLLTLRLLRKEGVILPAALAMALHKKLGLKLKTNGGKISYDEYPLFFLLLYCDIVQEWYRDPRAIRKPPILKKIVVTKDVNEIGEVKSKIHQKVIENNETIYIHSEIVLASDAAGKKIEEVEDWFGFIHSINPYFSIKINAEFFGSWAPDGHED